MTHTDTSPTPGGPSVAPSAPILVTGGTGKSGRRIAARLTALGHDVRIGSRAGTPPFDWNEPATWPAVLDGARAAYIAYVPDLAFPGALDTIRAFSAEAVGRGVGRLVLLSGRGEAEALAAEQVVRASGAETTVVRAAFFAQDFSEHFLLGPVLDGVIALPAGDVAEPFVDVDDIADVAVAALTDTSGRHAGQAYEVTGPRLVTFADAATMISAATGRDVRYLPVAADDYVAAAVAAGVPAEQAGPLADLFTRVFDGRNEHVTDGVFQALGRPPRDFADYARDAAAAGAWGGLTVGGARVVGSMTPEGGGIPTALATTGRFNGLMAQQTDDLASADRAAANPHTPFHVPADELTARLDEAWGSPADDGRVELVIRRPAPGEREVLEEATLDPAVGIVGDTWLERGSRHTPDGSAEPDRQLTLMNARVAALVAGTSERVALAGDQVYVDLDLSFDNLPAGTRLALGSAVVVVTDPPHTGCAKFTRRYGLGALRLINSPEGRASRFRGLNARVDVAGTVRPGDAVRKLA